MKEVYNIVNDEYFNTCKKTVINTRVKVELLDHHENTIGEITNRLSSVNGDISIKYNQGIRRTCNLTIYDYNNTLFPTNEDSVFFINKKFKIYVGLYDSDTDTIFWFSQGIFVTTSSSYSENVLDISGVDKFAFFTRDLNHHVLQNTYKILIDSQVGKTISDLITLDMGNGLPTDPISPIIDSDLYEVLLPCDIEKTTNETVGDILIEIATVLNADIYYNTDGHLVLTPSIVDEYYKQSPIYEIENDDKEFINSSLNVDYTKAVNEITVMGNNNDGIVYSYVSTNNNPFSNLRISNVGRLTTDVQETSMGYSEKRCKDYADYLLKKQSIISTTGTFNVAPLPHLDVNKILRLTKNAMGYDQSDFLISEITIPLQPSEYSLSISNIETLPFNYTSCSAIPDFAYYNWIVEEIDGVYSLSTCINNGGHTFVIAPRNVGTTMATAIGGANHRPVDGLQGVTDLYIEEGITTILGSALSNERYKAVNISPEYWRGGNDIQNITFPNTLKTIGDYAFCYTYLENDIILPNNVTSIGERAFKESFIHSITIPNNCTIGKYAFNACYNLESVYIGNNCVINGDVFQSCYNLKEIEFGEFCSFNNVIFYNLYNLENITFPNTSTITSVRFDECDNLKKVVLPPSVESIDLNTFEYCYYLEEVTIKNPNCEIYDHASTISGGYYYNNGNTVYYPCTIYGYEGSTAQVYAEKYGKTFIPL